MLIIKLNTLLPNCVPNKIITCRDKNSPWIYEVKKLCYKKANIYEKYVKNDRSVVDKEKVIRITKLSIFIL